VIKFILSIIANLINTETSRNLFIQEGGIISCVEILSTTTMADIQAIILTLFSNLFLASDCAGELVKSGAVPWIAQLISSPNAKVHSPAIAACINLATHEEIVDSSLKDLNQNSFFQNVSNHLKSTDNEVKMRAITCLSNFMGNESAQLLYRDIGGIDTLLSFSKSEKTEEIKLKTISSIFHMTMYHGRFSFCLQKINLLKMNYDKTS